MSEEITLETVQATAEKAITAFEAAKSDFASKKELDALEAEKLAKMSNDIAEGIEQTQKMNARAEAIEKKTAELEAALSRPRGGDKADKDAVIAKQSEVFNTFLKKGAGSNKADFADFLEAKGENLPEEIKALSVNSQADGGYLVLPAFGGVVDVRVFESSPIRQLASVVSITTDSYELVLDNDEAASGWVGEEASRTETTTPTLDKRIIPVHELYAKPKATQKMLDDGIVNVESWLAGKVAAKFARDEATAFVSGNGIVKPTGFLTNTTTSTSYDAENVQIIASASSGAIVYDDLVNTQNALKELYQGNATWLMKRGTLGTIMKIKSGITDDNTPIFNMQYSQNTGLETTLLNRPLRFADDMPAVGASANAIAYGDFRAGYLVVDRIGIRVLRDPYSAKPYVEFYSTKRVGGDVVNAEAIKILGLTG